MDVEQGEEGNHAKTESGSISVKNTVELQEP
jgi:hypothetical protein